MTAVVLSIVVVASVAVDVLPNVTVICGVTLVMLPTVTLSDAVVSSLDLVLAFDADVVDDVVGLVDAMSLPAFVVAIVSEDVNSQNPVMLY